MTRQRGIVRDIDKYELSRYNVKIPIHFDKTGGEFFAEYLEQRYSAETVNELKNVIDKEVRRTIALPWVPIIQIHLYGDAYTFTNVIKGDLHNDETYQRKHERVEASLKIDCLRYWIAQRTDKKWMECRIWDSRDWEFEGLPSDNTFLGTSDRRINAHDFYVGNNNKDFSLPFAEDQSFDEGVIYYLAYNENTWQALNAIGDKIGELLKQLQELIATDKGRLKLQSFVTRMLTGRTLGK